MDININHDDLSDVSDLDDSIGCHTEDERDHLDDPVEPDKMDQSDKTKHKVEDAKLESEVKKVGFEKTLADRDKN